MAKVLFLSLLFVAQLIQAASPDTPNLLLILVYDMGFADLSMQGSRQIKTPHIDALAKEGIQCTQAYVTAPVCSPSRAGLLTGRLQNRFGFEHNTVDRQDRLRPEFHAIPLDQPILSERLKAVGYRTGMIGKWHVGESVPAHLPNARGFDVFFGIRRGGHTYFPTEQKNDLYFIPRSSPRQGTRSSRKRFLPV